MRSDVLVIRRPVLTAERFAVIEAAAALLPPAGWHSLDEFMTASLDSFREQLQHAEFVDEIDLRTRLAARGFSVEEVDWQIRRARNIAKLAAVPTTVARTTRIGYRNEFDQVVIGKTAATGDRPFERIFLLRCDRCGHEHGAAGSEIHRRSCPVCGA